MRAHLFEIEDLSWCPSTIRDLGTDWIRFLADRLDYFRPVAPKLKELLDRTGRRDILDLCSGGGGGWLSLLRHLEALGVSDLKVTLSDKYPNIPAFEHLGRATRNQITYDPDPSDILNSPWTGDRLRTLLMSFHHFPPQHALTILRRAVAASSPVAICDAASLAFARRLPAFLLPLFVPVALILNLFVPLMVILLTPLVRPFRWTRILFTYFLPIVPLYIWWDATVSALRAYTVSELQRLVSQADVDARFQWEAGVAGGRGPRGVTYLIGYPAVSKT